MGATRTDDPAEEQAQKRLKSLLNKITKDNFAKITGQVSSPARVLAGRERPRGRVRPAVAGWRCCRLCLARRRWPATRLPLACHRPPTHTPTPQIIDVINERKLAKTLSGFINQIFDKALTETHFAELYADLVAA